MESANPVVKQHITGLFTLRRKRLGLRHIPADYKY
jgi:hypothetical protein